MGDLVPKDTSTTQSLQLKTGGKIFKSQRPGHLQQDSIFYIRQESYSYKMATIWLPKQGQNDDGASWHDSVDVEGSGGGWQGLIQLKLASYSLYS